MQGPAPLRGCSRPAPCWAVRSFDDKVKLLCHGVGEGAGVFQSVFSEGYRAVPSSKNGNERAVHKKQSRSCREGCPGASGTLRDALVLLVPQGMPWCHWYPGGFPGATGTPRDALVPPGASCSCQPCLPQKNRGKSIKVPKPASKPRVPRWTIQLACPWRGTTLPGAHRCF